jgi:NADH-quinone oxidoreductase subunit L
MERKWLVDEVYNFTVIRPAVATATMLARVDMDWLVDPIVNGVGKGGRIFSDINGWVDRNIVDGAVNFIGLVTDESSKALSLLQTGRVQNYFVILLAGLLAIIGIYVR